MLNEKNILALIPARGGSKGVPGKNIRPLGGRPLIAWTIEAAKKSRYIDRLVLSSDNADIMDVAKAHGCDAPFVRPAALSADDTPGIAPVKHCAQMVPGYDYMVILQPTSPFRSSDDIDKALESCIAAGARSLVSVTEANQHPSWMYRIDDLGRLCHVMEKSPPARRQDLPAVYALNGAIYVVDTGWLDKADRLLDDDTLAFPMPKRRSIDIDTALDFRIAEVLAEDMADAEPVRLYEKERTA